MNDFSFERPAWELVTDRLQPGDSLSAARFLTLLEGEDEAEVEAALLCLEQKRITLSIEALPKDYGTGQTEARLRREEMLVNSGELLEDLEETDPLRLYLEEIAGVPSAGDPALLVREYLAGDESALQRLVNVTISRAISMAQEMTGRGVLLMDLIQEASLGLWQGILTYQEGDLDSHLDWWIRQYLAKAVTLQARSSGVGQKLRRALEDYRTADHRLLTELGRNPTLEEIALELHVTPEEAEVYEDMLRAARAMEKAKQMPKEAEPEDDQAVEDTAYFQSRQRILDMLSTLNAQEAQVLTLRFGLEGGLPCSPQEAAAKLELTADQVLQLEAAALEKLRTEG